MVDKGLVIKKYFFAIYICLFIPLDKAHALDVITHIDNQAIVKSLTSYQLRQIYSMRQTVWSDGSTITVYSLASNSPLHHQFSKEMLKVFPYQLDKIWTKLRYSGLGKPPVIVDSLEKLRQLVIETPGSIGYVNKVNSGDSVYVLKIER